MSRTGHHTVVIGAGIGGLTAAALLLQAGQRVTVLEAHTYPGGSAGTFYNRGYRFDAGATLAGGFAPGGPHARLAEQLGLTWPVRPIDPAWITHLPELHITQWGSAQAWQDERQRAFAGSEGFWRTQERLADLAWDLASRPFPWPPASASDLLQVAVALRPRSLLAVPHLLGSVASLLPRSAPPGLRAFLDAQLLISAQTGAGQANALYGSAALDLPRRGVNAVQSGIGGLAQTLVAWIRAHGGEVRFRQKVTAIHVRNGRAVGLLTNKQVKIDCDFIVANLTPWGLADLLGEAAPRSLRREVQQRAPTWGAFILYLGLDGAALPANLAADHHQVIVDPGQALGECNSVFLSLSDPHDPSRAPQGQRAATISTHTAVDPWWRLLRHDPDGYAARKADYTRRVFQAAEQAIPGLQAATRLALPATPVTFEFYTHRPRGMVGGFAQTSLLRARSPHSGVGHLWLVGDSVFPGQSTAGVTLGGWRVANEVIQTAQNV